MGDRLRGVEHGEHPRVGGQRQQRLEGRPLAGGIGAGGHGEDPRARRQQAGQVTDVEPPLRVGPQDAQPRPAAPRRLLPGHQVGMVLQPADDDLVARLDDRRPDPRGRQAVGHEVERLGRSRGEDQFVRRTCADEALERAAGLFEGVGRALAQRVHAAVDIGPVVLLEAAHGVLHRQRRLRRGGVVQVGQRRTVDGLRQHREQRAQMLETGAVQAGAIDRGHLTHGRPLRRGARCRATASPSSPSMPSASQQLVVGEAALHQGTGHALDDQAACDAFVQAALAGVEQRILRQRAPGGAVGGLNLIVVDLQVRAQDQLRLATGWNADETLPHFSLGGTGCDARVRVDHRARRSAGQRQVFDGAGGSRGRVRDAHLVLQQPSRPPAAARRCAPRPVRHAGRSRCAAGGSRCRRRSRPARSARPGRAARARWWAMRSSGPGAAMRRCRSVAP